MSANVPRAPWSAAAAWWPPALFVGFFQVVGSFGAQDNQPERRALDALALGLLLVGPAFLFVRHRWPLASAVAAIGAADVYIAAGYPFGPVFASVVVTLFTLVGLGRRRQAWLLAAAGFAGFAVALAVDTRPGSEANALHLALVAGWLAVVLAVAEVVRMVRLQAAERAQAVAEERRRRAGEQRLHVARELHDVLAHNISLINVQASVALHLLDDQPEQARPALATISTPSTTSPSWARRPTATRLSAWPLEHRPDVVLMDIRMPGSDGLAATRRIAADDRLGGVKVVILTTFDLDEYVFEAIRAGANGFLVKGSEPAELLRAVRAVVAGDALLSPGVTRRLIAEFAQRAKDPVALPDLATLTEREREVVALVGEGLTNEGIAERLVMSAATAKTHVSRAMIKVGARDRAQLVVFAYETGLVRPGWSS